MMELPFTMTPQLSLTVARLRLHLLERLKPSLDAMIDEFMHGSLGLPIICIFVSHSQLFRGLTQSQSHLQQMPYTTDSAYFSHTCVSIEQIYIFGHSHTRTGNIFRDLRLTGASQECYFKAWCVAF